MDDFFRFFIFPFFFLYSLLSYRCYHPHRSRDALSPVCGIFFNGLLYLFPFGLGSAVKAAEKEDHLTVFVEQPQTFPGSANNKGTNAANKKNYLFL